jgi:hypothetical protein
MAITDTLADMWHAFEDKCWSLADFLEDKGIPIATFCENRGVSPALLFLAMLLAIIVLLSLLTAGAGVGTGKLNVMVESAGNPVGIVEVKYETPGGMIKGGVRTDSGGKATLEDVEFGRIRVFVDSSKWEGEKTIDFKEDGQSVTISAKELTGVLKIIVQDKGGGYLDSGTIEVVGYITGSIEASAPITGAAYYEFTLPVSSYTIRIKSISNSQLDSAFVELGKTGVEKTFVIDPDKINSASFRVIVQDEHGNARPGATVTLKSAANGNALKDAQITDAGGQTVFRDISMGTTLYPVVYVMNDRKFGEIDDSEGRNLYTTTVDEAEEVLTVNLELNGRVKVVVWDRDSPGLGHIQGASVHIMSKGGDSLTEPNFTNSEGEVRFVGFEENLEVYPVVTATGYEDYEEPGEAQPISYRKEVGFSVGMTRSGDFIASRISIVPVDIYGDFLTGVTAILSDPATSQVINMLANANNITFDIDGNRLYNVALYKSGYLIVLLEGVGPGREQATMEVANDANSGRVEVCAYANINGMESPSTAAVELLSGNGALMFLADTVGGQDGTDHCVWLDSIPAGRAVYVRASNDGYPQVESGLVDVIPKQQGIVSINVTFNEAPASTPGLGNIEVCVSDQHNSPVPGAEVKLFDRDTDGPSWGGSYLQNTGNDGCTLFTNLPAEKTGSSGTLIPVTVYSIVSAEGYSTYNGKLQGNFVDVQIDRSTPYYVRLGTGDEVCIVVVKDGEGVEVDVSLCEDASCSSLVETKKTDSDGHVTFGSGAMQVTVKVVSPINGYQREVVKTFSNSEVIRGSCGRIELEAVTSYATVTLDGIPANTIEAAPSSAGEIEFVVRVDDQPATGGSISTGTDNKVLSDGTEVLISLTGVTSNALRTVDATNGKYAVSFIAPSSQGSYPLTLSASIPQCTTCQGDQKQLTLIVSSGDSDGDGVPDNLDSCPGTLKGVTVNAEGCFVSVDSDKDGIPDFQDECPNTHTGVTVNQKGCDIGEPDSDNDGVPDSRDAYPHDPARSVRETEAEDPDNDLVPTAYDTQPLNPSQGGGSSIMICVVDESSKPIYESEVSLYSTGAIPAGAMSGTSGTYGTGTYGTGTYGTGTYGTGTYGTGTYGTGTYGTGTYGSQPWQGTQSSDNCRFFFGYSSFPQYPSLDYIFSAFTLRISSKGHEPIDTRTTGRPDARIQYLGNGMVRVDVVLKSSGGLTVGEGTLSNPHREVSLEEGDEWKASSSSRDVISLYPIITLSDGDINLRVKYTIESAASDDLDYVARYQLSGSRCFELQGFTPAGGTGWDRDFPLSRGQSSFEDSIVIHSKDECWSENDVSLEGTLLLTIDGQLSRIGDQEVKATNRFSATKVSLEPLVGADKELRDIGSLTKLSGGMTFADGVVTTGALPYCIDAKANTGKSKVASDRGVRDRSAADYKIILEFKGTNADIPSILSDSVRSIMDFIKDRLKKTPVDCKVYIRVEDRYMGYVEAGETGKLCYDARTQDGAKSYEPWEKLFCEAVEKGIPPDIQLKQGYSMRTDTK